MSRFATLSSIVVMAAYFSAPPLLADPDPTDPSNAGFIFDAQKIEKILTENEKRTLEFEQLYEDYSQQLDKIEGSLIQTSVQSKLGLGHEKSRPVIVKLSKKPRIFVKKAQLDSVNLEGFTYLAEEDLILYSGEIPDGTHRLILSYFEEGKGQNLQMQHKELVFETGPKHDTTVGLNL